jgi:hypothetical protein
MMRPLSLNEMEDPCIKTKVEASIWGSPGAQTKPEVIIGLNMTGNSNCQIALLSICRKSILSCVSCLHRDLRIMPRQAQGRPSVLPACLVNVTRGSAHSSSFQESVKLLSHCLRNCQKMAETKSKTIRTSVSCHSLVVCSPL